MHLLWAGHFPRCWEKVEESCLPGVIALLVEMNEIQYLEYYVRSLHTFYICLTENYSGDVKMAISPLRHRNWVITYEYKFIMLKEKLILREEMEGSKAQSCTACDMVRV